MQLTWINSYGVNAGSCLYTSPQPQEWVGLTTEMIDEIYQENLDDYEFAVALEAKLKELNT